MSEPMFPILGDPIIKAIPWAVLTPHEKQAVRNHSQSLRALASRGGLDVTEAVWIIRDHEYPFGKPLTPVQRANFRVALMQDVMKFEQARAEPTIREAEEAK